MAQEIPNPTDGVDGSGPEYLNSWVLAANEDGGDVHSLWSVAAGIECHMSNQASPVLVLCSLSSRQHLGLP